MADRSRAHKVLVHGLVALVLFLVACVLHFWKLDSSPKGFTPDEAAFAYNAYCVAETGADEYGTRWPLFFRSFDTYTDPVAIYSAVTPMYVFGLRPWAARLPSALHYLLACVAFCVLLRQWRLGTGYALAGGFTLSIIPWGIPMSRNGSFAGYSAEVLGLVAVLILTDRALRSRSCRWAVLAGVAWALAFYTQQSVRPVLALLVIGGGIVLCRPLVRRGRSLLTIMATALVVLLPMIVNMLRFPEAFTTRFRQVGVLGRAVSFADAMTGIASRYVDYFNPRFLFVSGDHELRHHTGFGGELYWSLAPLILAGLVVAIRYWRWEPRYRIVVVGLLASPVPAALTIDRMHATRDVNAVIFWLLLASIGARALWRHKPLGRKLLLVICAAGLVESTAYFADYFGPYQSRCRGEFQTPLTEALEYCFARIPTNQTLYVSGSVGTICGVSLDPDFKPFVYAQLLFHGRIDPGSYQHSGFANTVVRPYFEAVNRPGLLLRCNYRPLLETVQSDVVPNTETIPADARLLAAFRDKLFEYQVYEVK